MDKWIESLDKSLISVVLPTYNRPAYLGKCLQRIQSNLSLHSRIQIIVVDDGSSIQNKQLNRHFFNVYSVDTEDSKLIYLDKNTGSVSLPRNIGISHISGRSIAPTDDDCYPQPAKFSSLYKVLWENPETILSFGGRLEYFVKEDGSYVFRTYQKCEQIVTNKTSVGLDNGQFLYKADAYNHIAPVISINACDYHLYSEFAPFGDFVFVDEPVCSYLWHNKNNSLTPKPHRKDPSLLIGEYLQYFKDGPFKEKIIEKYINDKTLGRKS